jgi:uncharacterized protein YecT (DUF1311 family)
MLKPIVLLCVLSPVLSTIALGQIANETTPSFSCNGKLLSTEAVICSDDDLASVDRQLASIYSTKLRSLPTGQQAELEASEKAWLAERNSCGTNKSCIRNAYQVRIRSIGGPSPSTSISQQSPYVVDGLALGNPVRFGSEAYQQYHCAPSEKFPGFTWCHKEKTEKTKHGEVISSNSILHSQDGTTVYVNRYIEPAFLGPDEVRTEISRLSAKFGERAREIWMPQREGLPRAVIVVWGKIELQQLNAADASIVASGGTHKGLLVSFLGDLQHSAKAGVPVYQLSGGAGFLLAATFNPDGRGVLRFLASDASQIEPPAVAQNPPALPPAAAAPPSLPAPAPSRADNEEDEYAKIGWWSITHREVNGLSGCSARAQFIDQTVGFDPR